MSKEKLKNESTKKVSSSKKLTSTKKLLLLVTIVRKNKAEYFIDLIESNGANMQLVSVGSGTTKAKVFTDEIGTKAVIFSIVPEDKIKKLLTILSNKFEEIRDGKGVCWTIPLSSVMGVTFFNFLSNNKSNFIG